MKCNKFFKLIFCFALVFSFCANAASFTDKEAKAWVKDKGNLLLDAFAEDSLAKKYAKLDELFLTYVDLDYISKFVIGKYWRQMDGAQKQTYQALFKRYALGVYKSFPLKFKNRIDFEVINVVTKGEFKDVTTMVDTKEITDGQIENILITFKLKKEQDQIKILDIKITESSLILSYRKQFYQMVMDSGDDIGWFLEDFEAITASTEKINQQKLEEENNF